MPIVTLDSIKKKGGNHSDEEEEDEDGGNDYYTGGNNAQGGSGLAVHAPGKKDNSNNPLNKAMELASKQQQKNSNEAKPGEKVFTVTAYRNGFTVDGGPFRKLGIPENDEFAQALSQGFCPQELVINGKPANVRLENKSKEDYVETASSSASSSNYTAFSGSGHSVGEISETNGYWIVPGMESSGATIIVDDAKAKVKVQVKYPSGKKEVLKFETHHTVRHFIAKVELACPDLVLYQVLVGNLGVPKPIDSSAFDKTLTDAGRNDEGSNAQCFFSNNQAGLAGATVVVKSKSE